MRPILYTFRRCPYATRARLALAVSGVTVELREMLLRDKPPAFLAISQDKTIPLLVGDNLHMEHSLDIMRWSLAQNDPEGWLERDDDALISTCQDDFKPSLDRYKYETRYPEANPTEHRAKAADFLEVLEGRLTSGALHGDRIGLTDMAIVTFVRQFCFVDEDWFRAQPWPNLIRWLDDFLASDLFASVMQKYPKWTAGDPVTLFPDPERHAA